MMTSLQNPPTSSVGAFKNRPAAALLCVFLGGSLVASVATFADENWVFLATGLWAMTVMLLPVALQRHYDLFSIWSFVMLTVGVGLTLRGACLSFGFPSPERLDHLFLRGQPAAFFVAPAACLLLGLAMLTAGYCTGLFRKGSRAWRFAGVQYSPRRLFALSLILLTISAVASLVYIQRTGGFSAELLSAKRTPIPGANLAGIGYQSHGGLRFVGSLAMFAHLLVLAEIFSNSSRGRMRLPLVSLAALLLLVACVVPFYASLRTTVAMNLCMSAAMIYYSTKPVRVGVMAATVVTVLLVVYLMTALRPGSGFPNQAEHGNAIFSTTAVRVFEAAVINRNQIELAKTAHILHATPDTLPLKYGATISQWALATIPRSLWPDKPIIPPGPEIGREVYHQPIAGVPPSLVAELWWNFHLPGVVVGSFAFGVLLGFLQRRFGSSDDLLRMTIFVAGPMTLGFEAVGSSIGSGIFRGLLGTAVMVILVGAVRSAKAHHAPHSQPADESGQQAS